MQIPKIIHQIFEGRNGETPSDFLLTLSQTWKEHNPEWEYMFWDYKKIDQFLGDYFTQFIEKYHSFKYDVQRWDAIRYLILYQFGGLYADLDYECIEAIDSLVQDKPCSLGLDPPEHSEIFNKPYIISNAFMTSVPKHLFFKSIIDEISNNNSDATDKFNYVLETTGPYMLGNLYEQSPFKDEIKLIPSELISPLSKNEVFLIIKGRANDLIETKVEKAFAIHYFFGSWYQKK